MVLEEVSIGQGSDDGEGANTTPFAMDITSSDLELHVGAGEDQDVGMVFDPLDIPANSTITDAKIQFTVDEVQADVALTVTFEIEDVDDAATFTTTNGDLNDRVGFGTTVDWVVPHWVTDQDALPAQLTPDLKVLLQHVIDRAGWNTGQAVNFMIRSQSGSGARTAEAFGTVPPKLIVNYTTTTFSLTGDVRNLDLDTVGTVRCILLKHDGAAEGSRIYSVIDHVNANGSGLYTFSAVPDGDARYCVIAYNDETNDRRGVTSDDLAPVED